MKIYIEPDCLDSHMVRFIYHEKLCEATIVDCSDPENRADLFDINPSSVIPCACEKDNLGMLHNVRILLEYFDERFPYPPLMHASPRDKAEQRMMIDSLSTHVVGVVKRFIINKKPPSKQAKEALLKTVKSISFAVEGTDYFESPKLSIVDIYLAPALWRLGKIGVTLSSSKDNPVLVSYLQRLFKHPSFQASLSTQEREMRPTLLN